AFFPVWTPMEHFVPQRVWSRTALRGLAYPKAVATSVPQNSTLPSCSKVRMLPNSVFLKISIWFISCLLGRCSRKGGRLPAACVHIVVDLGRVVVVHGGRRVEQ